MCIICVLNARHQCAKKWTCDLKMCQLFSMWTRPKEELGWRCDLMDEGLLHFGMMENAITIDSWSSWGVEDATTLHLLCLFFWWYLLFVGAKCCFSFFMVTTMFGVDQKNIFWPFWSLWDMECERSNIWKELLLLKKLNFYV
jgi:hypothetical protein